MAKVFLDVGGYHGHSAMAALDPIFNFDRIYCFEAANACIEKLLAIKHRKLVLINACLSNSNGATTLFNPGTLAGSLFSDAPEFGGRSDPEEVAKIDVALFFKAFVRDGDEVWMKLNCEGSECDILESLLDCGEHKKLKEVLIDFDAEKIPSQRDRVDEVYRRVLAERVPHSLPKDVQYGMVNNYGGIRNWLLMSGAADCSLPARVASAIYNIGIAWRHPELSGYLKMRVLKLFPFLGRFARSRVAQAS